MTAATQQELPVALTFDFDAEAGLLGELGSQSPSVLSRGAYAANEGVPRILRLLEKYELVATFFIPGDTANRHPRETRMIADAGHEIAHHGYLHESLPKLTLGEERDMLARGLDAVERQTGSRPQGYRSSAWELARSTFSLLTEFGFTYDASQFGANRPHWLYNGTERTDIVELPRAWELTDSAIFTDRERPAGVAGAISPREIERSWRQEFDSIRLKPFGAAFVLTMHPEIIGRHHRMQLLERMIRYIGGFDDVKFLAMRDIAEGFQQREVAE